MDWLNYHHLMYFWTVAREGSVTRASERLHLSQPTVSAQIRMLEQSLGVKLLARSGRSLVLTETGRQVYRYADEIFTLGREMVDVIKGAPSGRPLRLLVGIADVVPKLIAYRLIHPALALTEPVQVVCREDKPEPLLADLSVNELDVVLSDAPVSPQVKVRAFSHLLGECGMTVFGETKLIARYRRNFPKSLHGAPMLLPTDNTMARRAIDHWFIAQGIRPAVAGEFEDSALLKTFGQAGAGLFFSPSAIEEEVCRQFGVKVLGRLDAIRERYYAISVERKLKHPAIVAISEAARKEIFATVPRGKGGAAAGDAE